ncbi:Heat shock protein 15 [BD1-7 clade bacterium]|uniref:Heat shock protein 15 n=1 Tax=BD1-7 clade bacterium TaxID=2029982 RepID=A0A5S9MVM3_9GAMM|nr:Heat shock protein 15 [BD1-7 clade bacterium]CAA0083767.1 Heat shock protein 15 [BD1-7 clade bacterium]
MGEVTASQKIRLDKWLWAARFFKTRSLAKQAIEGGKVHYNGARVKVSKDVELGAELRIRLGWDVKTVLVQNLSDKRRGASEAQLLYLETPESIEQRSLNAEQRKQMKEALISPDSKPDKKSRRQLQRMKHGQEY